MLNSIFRKQLVVHMGTLVISFAVLLMSLSFAFNRYFSAKKEQALISQGSKLANYILEYKYGFFGINSIEKLNNEVTNLNKYLDTSFFYVEFTNDGLPKITIASSDIQMFLGDGLSKEEFDEIFEGRITVTSGKLSRIYKNPVLTVGYPVELNGRLIGIIFMNSFMDELHSTYSELFKITFICLIFSAGVALVLIYLSAKSVSRPLHQINEAAKVITNGYFEKKIQIKTNDEVGQLAESFNNMAESLAQQEKRRSEFIANISHDLRSPLTSIRGFLQAILDGTIPSEKYTEYLSIVLEETNRLSKLANDLLDLNKVKIMEIKINRSYFDINDLIRNTIMKFETRIKDKGIKISLCFADSKTMVNADYEKIQRVIYNLLDNAIKFTTDEVNIETSIVNSKAMICISDNGPGISLAERGRIFEKFFKSDASRGYDKKGSGLGLSIVKAFVSAHDEDIEVDSEEGSGCVFYFSLDLAREEGF